MGNDVVNTEVKQYIIGVLSIEGNLSMVFLPLVIEVAGDFVINLECFLYVVLWTFCSFIVHLRCLCKG